MPAMDIIEGQCVRLTRGDFSTKKIYDTDPLTVAKRFEEYGVKRLHMVDLDGARKGTIINRQVLETVASGTSLCIDFGGGVQSDEDIHTALESGAAQVTAGRRSVREPDRVIAWIDRYGSDKIILGADVLDQKIAISGWQENSGIDLIPFIREYMEKGICHAICTDVNRDGVLAGPAIDLYQLIQRELPELNLIASGGVGDIKDVQALDAAGIPAVIIGKAIYEGKIKLEELRPWLC
ncbi:MAG: 1-(5-phosphoribosyl)-5-[(5-phosphoribosylamino)methylideneamino] imidazole-4-carboxamide isomerase [Calditrichales bacterium]|nr:MAG: 1-(5-phosphoribosyl)-5-[(5-phosphoribosylamino)methylideneamino] imidazole-4-carboxamide isomerase [Calditrichales bacterium]